MKHTLWAKGLAPLLVLLLPLAAEAQPTTDRATGLAPSAPSLDKDRLYEYLRAAEEVTASVAWDTAGDSRKTFGANRLEFTGTWRRPRGGGAPVLVGGELKPVGSEYFLLGTEKIYKLRINAQGEITVDRKGINTTIYKITRKANGDLVLDMPWYHGGDRTIKAADVGPVALTGWPPRLDELVRTLTERPSRSTGTTTTRHEGTFTWNVKGRADPTVFPMRGGAFAGSTAFDVRGAGRLGPDGSFTTIGDGNRATLTLNVGGHRYARDNGSFSLDPTRGGGTFEGRYAISVPRGDAGSTVLDVDGRVRYDVTGRNLVLDVPSGARVSAGEVHLTGDGRLAGSIRGGDDHGALTVRDGTYHLEVTGPLGVSGLKVAGLSLDDVRFEGTNLTSDGRVEELSADRFALSGELHGSVDRASRGAANALLGEEGGQVRFGVGADTRLTVDLDELRVDTTMPGYGANPRDVNVDGHARGRVHGTVDMNDATLRTGDLEVSARRARSDLDLVVDASRAEGLRDAHGTVSLEAREGGRIRYDGLPGAPVVPARSAEREHRVVSGDTVGALARRYGVDPDRLRSLNGIPASGLIRVGDVLRIPGASTPSAPAPAPSTSPGAWESELAEGSRVDLDIDSARIGPDGVVVEGRASASVQVRSAEVTGGSLTAKILGAARASLANTAFRLQPGPDGRYQVKVAEVRVPVRIDLARGSTVRMSSGAMDVEMSRDGSYAEFTAVVKTGPDGRLRLDEMAKVDLLLHGNGAARFAGRIADLPGEKTIRYEGRMAFVERGIDFFGDITVRATGSDTTPAVRIRW